MVDEQVLTMILKDGTSTGIIECGLDEWYGISYKIPRNKLKNASKLKYINNTGVYILIGDGEETSKKIAYIGEAEDIHTRLEQHNRNKDFWNECIVFMSENNSLNKAHIKYIEHELYIQSTDVNRYIVKNDSTPTKSSLDSADEIKARKFIEKVKVISSVLGYRLFDELISKDEKLTEDNENILYLQYKGATMGRAIATDEGIVILKGSQITDDIKPSVSPTLEKYILKERSSADIENGVFINNHLVNSPSMACAILLGSNRNGRTDWKNKDGKTLKEIQESE